MANGHGEKLSRKQEQAIVALLQHATIRAAAAAVPVNERTLRAWMRDPAFAAAYAQARRELLDVAVAKDGARDGDRVRAAVALLDHAVRGVELADVLHGDRSDGEADKRGIEGTGDVVRVLAERLRQVDAAELPTGEKSRLTATLADALLRAIGADVLDKRLEALQAVLIGRKEQV